MYRMIRKLPYLSYIICMLGVFLYFLFPSDVIQRYAESWVENNYPGMRLSITRIKPELPLGLSVQSSKLLFEGKPVIFAEKIRLKPQLQTLFRPSKQIGFSGHAAGGRFQGTITFEKTNATPRLKMTADVDGIDLAKISGLQDFASSGTCSGGIQPEGDGTMSAQMKILDCNLRLPIQGADSLILQELSAQAVFRKGQIEVKEAHFKGAPGQGYLSGVIDIKAPIENSILRLSGKMKPDYGEPASQKGEAPIKLLSKAISAEIAFEIKGTLKDPQFSIRGAFKE